MRISSCLRLAAILALPVSFLFTEGSSSCGAQVVGALLGSNVYVYGVGTTDDGQKLDLSDKLLVDGSGESIDLEYNDLVFPAQLNYDDGIYSFAPDPDGLITGDRIVCAASIDQDEVVGDCFRQDRVCHFEYGREGSADHGKDVYDLDISTCRRGGEVGPFLVPLDGPMCGQDPYPACPNGN